MSGPYQGELRGLAVSCGVLDRRSSMRRLLMGLGCTLLVASACWFWQRDAALRAGGPTPYTRCLAGAAAEPRDLQVAALRLHLSERALRVSKAGPPLRIAAFSVAGMSAPTRAGELEPLRRSQADLLLLLGGLGDSPAIATATVRALAALPQPALILLGGRDASHVARDALAGSPRLIDISALRRVELGSDTLIPLAGAEHGRYALDETRCGFGDEDLEHVLAELGAPRPGERRWSVSWQAPSASVKLARFVARSAIRGSLSAWPPASWQSATAGLLVGERSVPRLFGPRIERPDGSRATPGLLLLEASNEGLRVVEPE
jgi:hypothetical protein